MDAKTTRREDTLEQARIIFRFGGLMHDRVSRVHTTHEMVEDNPPGQHLGLSVAQMYAVMATREYGQVSVSQLAELLGVSPASASSMVDRLVEKGILTRRQSQEDRRKVIVQTSPEENESIRRTEERILQWLVKLLERIGPETAEKWCDVVERVQEVLIQDNGPNRNSSPGRR